MAGYAVVINHRDSHNDARKVTMELCAGKPSLVVRADVADHAAVTKMADEVLATFGRIDVLVNNAGVTMPAEWQTLDPRSWDRCLAVNLTGTFNCIQRFAPHLARTKRGRIVNIGSTYSQIGAGVIAAYAAAKAGITSLTRTFARELAPEITVNAVAPGNIDTDMTRLAGPEFVKSVIDQTPLRRLGDPAEVAAAVRFIVSDEASFITGQTFVLDGGHALGGV
jgi:3-oxoacyl-[acyl-carrier protein] reductase